MNSLFTQRCNRRRPLSKYRHLSNKRSTFPRVRTLTLEPLEGRMMLSLQTIALGDPVDAAIGIPGEPDSQTTFVAAGPGFGAAGDSLTDEYGDAVDYARNWLELLAEEKGVNFGPHGDWGTPRAVGYQHNWAVGGATSGSLLDSGQHTGLVQLIDTGAVSYAVLAIGQNDFAPNSAAYQGIYSNTWSQTDIDTYVDGVVENIDTALDTLTTTDVALVMSNVIDYGLAPLTKVLYPSAESRGRVTTVLVELNDRLEDLAFEHQVPIADAFGLARDFLGTGSSPTVRQRVGGVTLINAGGVDPHNAFVADAIHPHTIVQGLLGNLFLEAMSLGHGIDVGSLQFTEEQLLSAAGIGDEYTEDTFGLSYSDYVVLPSTISVPILGPIDFLLLEHLSLADGSLYSQIETTHEGFLSLQIDAPEPSTSARLKLYDRNPVEHQGINPLAASILDGDGNQRITWATEAGALYYVEVYGDNADFDVRAANLIDVVGTAVTVYGTDGDDTFEFDASASRTVTINGIRHEFDDAEVTSVTFNGEDGIDTVLLYDSSGDEILTASPGSVHFESATEGFTVEASGFEALHAYALAGGNDSAVLHGSATHDKLKSYEDFVRLRAKNMDYSLRAKFFDSVVGDAGSGGNNTAVFNSSNGINTFRFDGSINTTQMQSAGRNHKAIGFGRVIARAGDGSDDVAYFTDVPGDDRDVFYFKPHKTELVGSAVKVTARAFDEVHAEAGQGGFNVARIYDTAADEHFEFIGGTARVYRRLGTELDLLYEAIGFDRVKAYRSTGEDTKDDASHGFGDELYLYGWEE